MLDTNDLKQIEKLVKRIVIASESRILKKFDIATRYFDGVTTDHETRIKTLESKSNPPHLID